MLKLCTLEFLIHLSQGITLCDKSLWKINQIQSISTNLHILNIRNSFKANKVSTRKCTLCMIENYGKSLNLCYFFGLSKLLVFQQQSSTFDINIFSIMDHNNYI